MPNRFQHGSVLPVNGSWRGYFYATTFDVNGLQVRRHRSQVLDDWPKSTMTFPRKLRKKTPNRHSSHHSILQAVEPKGAFILGC